MKKPVRLNNILFPIWLFWLLPTYVWLIILPANFVIDSLVLVITMNVFRLENKLSVWKHSILKVWIIGFVSDFIGAAVIFGIMLVLDSVIPRFNTILFPGTTLISLPGVVLAGVLIYFLNRRFSFTKCELSAAQVHKFSLALAVFTAPYAMMIPLYG